MKAIRKYYHSDSMRLSYVDFGGGDEAPLLIALHGHFGNARMFARLAQALPEWRVVALDQRGHGWSGHAHDLDYSRDSYIRDIYALIQSELGGKQAVLLGHSLGGVNAYQFAARYPDLVRAMVIEDIGAEVSIDGSEATRIPQRAESITELQKCTEAIFGEGSFLYFAESACEEENGWRFRFHADGIAQSQRLLGGDWWSEWLSTDCPTLLIHGHKSWAVGTAHIREMKEKRPNTTLAEFPSSGHTVHDDEPVAFVREVRQFLAYSKEVRQPGTTKRT